MTLKTGVIGAGYWGTNIIRVVNDLSDLCYICDLNTALLDKKYNNNKFRSVTLVDDYKEMLKDSNVEAVFIITPPETHYNIAKDCLNTGKHVFIEKPMTAYSKEASKLITLANRKKLKLAVGHTFLYSSPVNKVKEIIDSGELGEILHVQMSRQNLGKFQSNCDVIYDLSPHDLSMLLYWFPGFDIEDISVTLLSHHKGLQPDTAYVDLISTKGLTVNMAYSWIYPYKIRNTVIVGDKKSIVYDDTNANDSIIIYNKGIELNTSNFGDFICSYRTGDCTLPYVKIEEPLKREVDAFFSSILYNEELPNSGENGRDVVRLIEKIKSAETMEN